MTTSKQQLSIALCMIVRDEQRDLPDCLASVRGVVDEMIVVDTGSEDDTVAIAERAGAKVVHFQWCDDFSAARNASIQASTADWILWLDADERLAEGAAARLREKLQKDDFDCGMLRLHDAKSLSSAPAAVMSGRERIGDPMYVPRLLRRTDDLAFSGIVHESVRPWLLRHGNRVKDMECDIVHYGAVPEQRSAREKAGRNTALLEKRLLAEPDDFTIHGYLAHEHIAAQRTERAWEIVEEGWALLRKASPETLRSALRLTAARALIQFQRGDAQGALDSAKLAASYEGDGPDLLFFRGRAHEMLAQQAKLTAKRHEQLGEAERCYRACLALRDSVFAQRYVRGASSWAGQMRLATVRMLQGDPEEALGLFETSHAQRPEVSEGLFGRAEALVESGEPERAMALLEPQLAGELKDHPDGWLVAAQAADAHGNLPDFKRHLASARERSGQGYVAAHRNERHGSAHCQLLAYLGQPSPGAGTMGTVTALMARQPPKSPPGAIAASERRTLRTLVRNMLLSDHAAAVEPLLEDDSEALLPGLRQLVTDVVSSLGMSIEERS